MGRYVVAWHFLPQFPTPEATVWVGYVIVNISRVQGHVRPARSSWRWLHFRAVPAIARRY
jgi:hypothetical protein